MARKRKEELPPEVVAVLDSVLEGVETVTDLEAVWRRMKGRMIERILEGELTGHLGYPPGGSRPDHSNARNGSTPKTVITDDDRLRLAIPRDRAGTFEPALVPKGVRRLPGFDAKVLSMYALGMTVRDMRTHLEECYQVPISPETISTITDAVMAEAREWQQRPLDSTWMVVVLDGLRVKLRRDGRVHEEVLYVALGFGADGRKEVLGMWLAESESASFWQRVLGELRDRGVDEILIALIDGLKGFKEAVKSVYPETQVHRCVVHLVRQSLRSVPWQERKQVARSLKEIYHAVSLSAAEDALDRFEASSLGQKHPHVVALWRRTWEDVAPALEFPLAVRRVLYTTNAIENLNKTLRKRIKTRGHFPSEDAAIKLIYLGVKGAHKGFSTPPHWNEAMRQFRIIFGNRVPEVID